MSNVVLVVDMVIGFMEPDHNLYCGDEARQIIPRVQQLIEREQAAGARGNLHLRHSRPGRP